MQNRERLEIEVKGKRNAKHMPKKFLKTLKIPLGDTTDQHPRYISCTIWIPDTPGNSHAPKICLTMKIGANIAPLRIYLDNAKDLVHFTEHLNSFVRDNSVFVSRAIDEALEDWNDFQHIKLEHEKAKEAAKRLRETNPTSKPIDKTKNTKHRVGVVRLSEIDSVDTQTGEILPNSTP